MRALRLLALAALSACAEQQPHAADGHAQGDAPAQDASAAALDSGATSATPGPQPAVDAGAAPLPEDRDASPDATQAPIAAARASLVIPERWLPLDVAADPFDDRPSSVDCDAGVAAETLSEERVLGVETGWCNYLTAMQPAQRAVAAGEVIKVRLWHFELAAPEPAEAHAAVHVAGLRVLDQHIAIPSPGGLIVEQLTAEQAIPAGAPVFFHLHNHGANSWALVEVSAGPAAP